ncbi:hypothetical protein [uncultured Psychroserpens sp.]|uniref:hypothetical protein n=1 Tax=uncultured Psychroserpens sp. TaxID=255436 RepID=UPI002631640B|nr:hypothetical protein [uncultured Psychroserpens sp.]
MAHPKLKIASAQSAQTIHEHVTTHLRITAEHIRENYLILIIKLSILCLFIYSLISGISNIIEHFNAVIDYTANQFEEYFYIATSNYYLRPSLILLFPIVGISTNKKIGWILIQSYFYFLITNLAFPATKIDLTDNTLIILNVIGFLLILLIIILMNKNKISNLVYGIKKSKLINMNIIASIIGISITLILVMF